MPKGKTHVSPAEIAASSVLDRIVEVKRQEVAELRPRRAELRSIARDAPPSRAFRASLHHPLEVRLLAEVKRRSPSAGEIRPGADPAEIARGYQAGGAAALSVLTDVQHFGGSLDALRHARAAVELPLLRKDFVIAEEQVWEGRAAGADAILLIARILTDARLGDLHALSLELEMDVLVEVHTEAELDRVLAAGATLVGVNNRDLATFTTDLGLSLRLAERVPDRVTLVAESGIRTAADVDALGAAGFNAILVGESLMRQPDVAAAANALTGRRRSARGP